MIVSGDMIVAGDSSGLLTTLNPNLSRGFWFVSVFLSLNVIFLYIFYALLVSLSGESHKQTSQQPSGAQIQLQSNQNTGGMRKSESKTQLAPIPEESSQDETADLTDDCES